MVIMGYDDEMKKAAGTVIVLLLLAQGLDSSPLYSSNICGPAQCEVGSKLRYDVGQTYTYRYSTDTTSSFEGTSAEESRLHFSAKAELYFTTACEGHLTLNHVTLQDSDPNDPESRSSVDNEVTFQNELARHSLRFSYHNGVIEELCPELDEPTWVLNIKRGILSALVNSMKRLDMDYTGSEVDVNGACDVSYSLEGTEGSKLLISKTRDLSTCSQRYGLVSAARGVPYTFPSGHQSLPLLDSRSNCDQVISRHLIVRSECNETHRLRPFAKDGNGAVTFIRQELELLTSNLGYPPVQNVAALRRESIVFDHHKDTEFGSASMDSARQTLQELCTKTADGAEMESAELFSQLVSTLRGLQYKDLSQVYRSSSSVCSKAKRLLLDALPALHTSASVFLMRDHIREETVPTDMAEAWMQSLAFFPQPDHLTVEAVVSLTKLPSPPSHFLLPASSLLHTYCLDNVLCSKDSMIEQLLEYVLEGIDEECSADDKASKEKLLVTLKAIGNLGMSTEKVVEGLERCLLNEEGSVDVRVAAVEAFRRFPCGYNQEPLWDLFRHELEDSELRIASYLTLMRCPNYLTILAVKDVLEYEEVNQVGAFVVSHLRNLQETSMPSKAEIQGLVVDEEWHKNFKSDIRTFSQNLEASMFHDELNIGGSAESNVIFSTNSFVPRSAMLNMTVDMFGQSINLFELTLRAEGWEHYLESLFGPKGRFHQKTMHEILQGLRKKRAVPSRRKWTQINKTFNAADRFYSEPQLSLSTKTFGNEIKYASWSGLDEVAQSFDAVDPMKAIQQLVSGKEMSYQNSFTFLDSTLVVPTCAGFPLKLSTLGTAVLDIQMRGLAKSTAIFQKGEFQIEGKIQPSAAVEIVGSMNMDATVASSGIKVRTQLHSSMAVEGSVDIQGTRLARVEFGMPKEKLEVIHVRSELLVSRGKEERKQTPPDFEGMDEKWCSGISLERTLGLRTCTTLLYPNTTAPDFPLNGPSAFRLSLEKTDPGIRSFVLDLRQERTKDRLVVSTKIAAEGSTQEREVSAKVLIDQGTNDYAFYVQVPGTRVEAKGKFKNEDAERSIDMSLEWNGKEVLSAQTGVKQSVVGNTVTYTPSASFTLSGEKQLDLRGEVHVSYKKGISNYEVKIDLQASPLSAQLTGQIQRGDLLYSTRMKLEYQLTGKRKESMKIDCKLSNHSSKSMVQMFSNMDIEFTQFPSWNFIGSWQYQRADGHMENRLELNYSQEQKNDRHKLTLLQQFTYSANYEGVRLTGRLQASQPSSGMDYLLAISHLALGNTLDSSVRFRYQPEKEVVSSLSLKKVPGSTVSVEGSLNLTMPGTHPISLSAHLQEQQPGEYKGTVTGSWLNGKNFNLMGSFVDRSSKTKLDVEVNFELNTDHLKSTVVTGKLSRDETDLQLVVQVTYMGTPYVVKIKYNCPSHEEMTVYTEFRKGSRMYSANFKVDLKRQYLMEVDLHLDTRRDLYFKCWLKDDPSHRLFLTELKWDANRDPTQKVAVELTLDRPHNSRYKSELSLVFPGRTIKGTAAGGADDGKVDGYLNLEWEPGKLIHADAMVGLLDEATGTDGIAVKVTTPFPQWPKTYFIASITTKNDVELRIEGGWLKEQMLLLSLSGNHEFKAGHIEAAFSSNLTSTIKGWEDLTCSFRHVHHVNNIKTNFEAQWADDKTILVKSEWTYRMERQLMDATGNVAVITPFSGFKNMQLSSHNMLDLNSKIESNVEVKIDLHKYNLKITGPPRFEKQARWNLLINTPQPGYENITVTLSVSTVDIWKFILDLKWPEDSLTFKGSLQYNSWSSFDGRLQLTSPFQNAELLATLLDKRLEMKGSIGEDALGVMLSFHTASSNDLWVGVGLQTPMEFLKRIGAEVRCQLGDETIINVGAELNDDRLGVRVESSPFRDEPLEWLGKIEIHPLIYPPLHASILLHQEDNIIFANMTVAPFGPPFSLQDRFQLDDLLNFSNMFSLHTPYDTLRHFHLKFQMESDLEAETYTFGVESRWSFDGIQWTDCGLSITLHVPIKGTKNIGVKIDFPMQILREITLTVGVEDDENYKLILFIRTQDRTWNIMGDGKINPTMKEITLSVASTGGDFKSLRIEGSLDTRHPETTVKLYLGLSNPSLKVLRVQGSWQRIPNYFKASCEILSPFEGYETLRGHMDYSYNPEEKKRSSSLELSINSRPYSINMFFEPNYVRAFIKTPYDDVRAAEAVLSYHAKERGKYDASLTITWNQQVIRAEGDVEISDKMIKQMQGIVVTPFESMRQLEVMVSFPTSESSLGTRSAIRWGDKEIELIIDMEVNGPRWKGKIQVTTPFAGFEHLNINFKFQNLVREKFEFAFEMLSPYEGLENVSLQGQYNLIDETQHQLVFNYTKPEDAGEGELIWSMVLMESFDVKVKYFSWEVEEEPIEDDELYEDLGEEYEPMKEGFHLHVSYKNPGHDYTNFHAGLHFSMPNPRLEVGANCSASYVPGKETDVTLNLVVPIPEIEVHTIHASLIRERGFHEFKNTLSYSTLYTEKKYLSFLKVHNKRGNFAAASRLEWSPRDHMENDLRVRYAQNEAMLQYDLSTAAHPDKMVELVGEYLFVLGRHRTKLDVKHLSKLYAISTDIHMKRFPTMDGVVNMTTPYEALPEGRMHFKSSLANRKQFNGKYEFFWSGKEAVVDVTNSAQKNKDVSEIEGRIDATFPMENAKSGSLYYSYKGVPVDIVANFGLDFNSVRILGADYTFNSSISNVMESETTFVEVSNHLWPFGLLYKKQFEFNGARMLPSKYTVSGDLYHLQFKDTKRFQGEMIVKMKDSGRDISLKGSSVNRTMQFLTDYSMIGNKFTHNTKLSWTEGMWISYTLNVLDLSNRYAYNMRATYPARSVLLVGSYHKLPGSLDMEADFNWDTRDPKKKIGAVVHWNNQPPPPFALQRVIVLIKNPKLQTDLRAMADYQSNMKDFHGAKFSLDYSPDVKQRLTAAAKAYWESSGSMFKQWATFQVEHNATMFNFEVSEAGLGDERGIRLENKWRYVRGDDVSESMEAIALLDYSSAQGKIEWIPSTGKTVLTGKVNGHFPEYTIDMGKTYKDAFDGAAKLRADLDKPFVKLLVSYDQESTDTLNIEGGVIDTRHITFNSWEQHNLTKLPRVQFHVRLNNTHLLTSRLGWNPAICSEFQDKWDNMQDRWDYLVSESVPQWQEFLEEEYSEMTYNLWDDMETTLQPFLDELSDLETFADDYGQLLAYVRGMYDDNEFYMRDIYGVAVLAFEEVEIRYEEFYKEFVQKLTVILGDAGVALEKVILKAMEALRDISTRVSAIFESSDSSRFYEKLDEMYEHLLESYSQLMKTWNRNLQTAWNYYSQMAWQFVNDKVLSLVERWKPKLLQVYHNIETAVWKVVTYISDYLYETKDDLSKNRYYQKLKSLAQDIDEFYQDMTTNDAATNIRKYYSLVVRFLQERYANLSRFRNYLGDFGNFLAAKWDEYMRNPRVAQIAEYVKYGWQKIAGVYNYLDIKGKVKEILVTLYVKGTHLFTQNAIEAVERHTGQKTKFIFDPEHGNIELEQKLPFPWHSFDQEPLYDQLPEYQAFKNFQDSFKSSNRSFWDYYYQWKPYFDMDSWAPPFKGHALLIGPSHFMTFDGVLYKMKGSCAYVLASDFVDGNFTLTAKYNSQRGGLPEVILTVGKESVIIDLSSGAVRNKRSDLQLPAQMDGISVYQERVVVTAESSSGVHLECNIHFGVCRLTLSGWYFAKTGGLFGTLDHEASNDLWTPERLQETDHQAMAQSWDVGETQCEPTESEPEVSAESVDHRIRYMCDKLYRSQVSELQPCFSIVDPEPFYQICLQSPDFRDKVVCTSAVGYMEACRAKDIPLRIPSLCIKCSTGDGKEMVEGELRQVEGRPGRPSTDVVFLVEAKSCNRDIKQRRKMQELIEMINKELSVQKVITNRYAVVVFGGDGVYWHPHVITSQGTVFASPQSILTHFDQIPVGGDEHHSNIFEALLFASRLPFRPGASRTFILIPCGSCSSQEADYTTVHQALLERDVTLHILMNGVFHFDKPRESKTFFGMDGSNGYTKRDAGKGQLVGDPDLRRQVRLPKSALGYCTPLALETNGTVFAGRKLEAGGKNLLKKFLTVFGRRVALTAAQAPCHLCECAADNDGASFFECHPCIYPRPAYIEYGFEEEFSLAATKRPRGSTSEEDYGDE